VRYLRTRQALAGFVRGAEELDAPAFRSTRVGPQAGGLSSSTAARAAALSVYQVASIWV
jgi:hypothetical protein